MNETLRVLSWSPITEAPCRVVVRDAERWERDTRGSLSPSSCSVSASGGNDLRAGEGEREREAEEETERGERALSSQQSSQLCSSRTRFPPGNLLFFPPKGKHSWNGLLIPPQPQSKPVFNHRHRHQTLLFGWFMGVCFVLVYLSIVIFKFQCCLQVNQVTFA